MENAITIREAQPQEAEMISELCMRSKAYWEYSDGFLQACRDELSLTRQYIESSESRCMVAVLGSELVGYYAIEKRGEEEYELEALFVDPPNIGTGVGKALMDHAKTTVAKLGGKVIVIQGDPHAEKFYRAAGASLVGSRESSCVAGRSLPLFKIELAGE